MLQTLLLVALTQTPTPVFLTGGPRPAQDKRAHVSPSPDGGWALEVTVVSTSATSSSGGTVTQGAGVDGGQAWNVNGQVAVTNFPATQPVSLASMPSTPVTGPLTDTQLRASAVPVSLASTTVTNFPATQAVSGAVAATQGLAADGGTEWGVRLNNAATSPSGAIYTYGVGQPNPFPLNPFLPRCNAVRKVSCQP